MRRSRGLTQAGLAQRAAISTDSVRRYEAGNRQPSTASMSRLADALELHGSRRRSFFDSAGVDEAPPPDQEIGIDGYETVSVEIETILDAVPWPSFVAGDIMDLVAANRAAEMLWDVDLSAEFKRRSRAEVSFLSIAAERRFATRIVNWEEPVAALISVLKAMPRTSLMLDDASPLLSDVLEAFAENDPGALGRLFTLWESTPPAEAAIRWGFPITWNDPRVGELRFLNLVDAISAVDGFSFNAWLPRDAETVARWQELEARSRPISQRRP
jgi:transcriptional regulator with XRE-family HTH domain